MFIEPHRCAAIWDITVEPVSLERKSPFCQPNQQFTLIQPHLAYSTAIAVFLQSALTYCNCVQTQEGMTVSCLSMCAFACEDGIVWFYVKHNIHVYMFVCIAVDRQIGSFPEVNHIFY